MWGAHPLFYFISLWEWKTYIHNLWKIGTSYSIMKVWGGEPKPNYGTDYERTVNHFWIFAKIFSKKGGDNGMGGPGSKNFFCATDIFSSPGYAWSYYLARNQKKISVAEIWRVEVGDYVHDFGVLYGNNPLKN